mmetsp:Transcript_9405/g.22638  ORF Transcript_9405/g.22638 Transcript_9405/m.22638 type:complete len:242 (+) Transcript_9405:699-1424(+)
MSASLSAILCSSSRSCAASPCCVALNSRSAVDTSASFARTAASVAASSAPLQPLSFTDRSSPISTSSSSSYIAAASSAADDARQESRSDAVAPSADGARGVASPCGSSPSCISQRRPSSPTPRAVTRPSSSLLSWSRRSRSSSIPLISASFSAKMTSSRSRSSVASRRAASASSARRSAACAAACAASVWRLSSASCSSSSPVPDPTPCALSRALLPRSLASALHHTALGELGAGVECRCH